MELYYSPTGDDAAPGTDKLPKRDPSLGTADAKYLEAGGEFFPTARVKAAQQICAYGSGAPPRLNGRNVVDIGVDLIDNIGTTVSDLEIYGYLTRGIHGGLTSGDPLRKRSLALSRLFVHDILGQADGIGIQMWGAGIVYTDVRVQHTRSDSIWHNGADITMRRCVLIDPSCQNEGMGDCLQTVNLSSRIDIRGLVAVHYTRDKQAVLLSGPAGSMIPNGACVIDGLTASGYSSGAGLVTIQGLRGVAGTNWSISMPSGPANAGISFIDGASGRISGGSLVGYTGAVAVRTSGGPVTLAGISRIGWAPGGVV